ncbi:MAG: hypothetical protein IH571_03360 [Acholeplasmataceae bacterium]|nr:hypothetical protein [Acholeplasmataceae bacterium]
MKIMKKILTLFIEPLKMLSSRNLAEKISVFFNKHQYLVYIIAFLIVAGLIFMTYIYPYIAW